MRNLILIAVAAIAGLSWTQEPGPPPRVIPTDAEVRANVRLGLKTPGHAVEVDDGVWIKAWPSHDRAVVVPGYFTGGSMYRAVFVIDDAAPLVLGAETMDGVRSLIRAMAMANVGRRVLCAISEPAASDLWLNADGSPCKVQDQGPQWRAVEARVVAGSVGL